jgi:hypothetical protein
MPALVQRTLQGVLEQPPGQQALEVVLGPRPLGHQGGAVSEQAAEPLGAVVGLPDRGQVVATEELGEDLGVDLVGLDLGLGDGVGLERIADDDLGDEGAEDVDDGPGVGGGLQGEVVALAELGPGERLQLLSQAAGAAAVGDLALVIEGTDFDELLVEIEADVSTHCHASVIGPGRGRVQLAGASGVGRAPPDG